MKFLKTAKTTPVNKITPRVFPLTSVAGRVALLVGIAAKTVTTEELEVTVLHDTEKRAYRKPLYAAGKRYSSVRKAAIALVGPIKFGGYPTHYANSLDAMAKKIARWCNEDNRVGYYWSK